MQYQSGDIIVTRSTKWYWNFVPGYWNHCGMFIEINGFGFIIEALPFYGVILIGAELFFSRRQTYKVLRHLAGKVAARESLLFLGRNYAIFTRKGENCVSLVRKVYEYATHRPIFWLKPDDILTRLGETGFQVVFDSEKGQL